MNTNEKIKIILNFLETKYKNAKCSLNFKKPYQLLIAARLSAQCTDKKVNTVTKNLFLKYDNLISFSNASYEEIKNIINSCGLSNKKSKDIVDMCSILIKKFNEKVPSTMKDLLTLPGIGRKTANLILGEIYKKPVIIVDTHMIRISNKLGLVKENNPEKIEKQLLKIVPKNKSKKFCHMIIEFGRNLCTAKKPLCSECGLKKICTAKTY